MKPGFRYTVDYFDKRGHTPPDIKLSIRYHGTIAYILKRSLNPSSTLDIGCAKGFLPLFFKGMGVKSMGVDISEYAISQAPEEVRGSLFVADAEKEPLPFPDSSFDLATIFETLEHLETHGNLMRELSRVLRNGGYAGVTIPTNEEFERDETHVVFLKRPFWEDLFSHFRFEKADLEVEAMRKIYRDERGLFMERFREIYRALPPISNPLRAFIHLTGERGKGIRADLVSRRYYRIFERYFFNKFLLFRKPGGDGSNPSHNIRERKCR